MRPLKLSIRGFTAFRDPVELDFEPMDVFAISGPTGSGKSSLLDAMTYALYGRVERVGDRVGQLISQGQPRMSVTLEFEVGYERHRVTRSTPSGRGATKILLERQGPDGEWSQAGEGSDRVRDVEKTLVRLIGLTYDGFTRSVLLPQGRFAEFMVGDPRKRREILTELLGLSMFERMKKRAGAISAECALRAQERTLTLERDFADVTSASVKEAKAAATAAADRERDLAAAAEHVGAALERWKDAERGAEDLRACLEEARAVARVAASAAEDLAAVQERLDAATATVTERAAEAATAEAEADRAGTDLRDADARLGADEALSAARLWAHDLAEGRVVLARRDTEAAERDSVAGKLAVDLAGAEEDVATAATEEAERRDVMAQADEALERARHADLVAAVSAGLRPGDPCPVCGRPLDEAPPRRSAGTVERATKALSRAKAGLEEAAASSAHAHRAAAAARQAVDAHQAAGRRLEAEAAELRSRIVEWEDRVATVLGRPLPEDPAAEVDARLARRRALEEAERAALARVAAAAAAAKDAERDRDAALAAADAHRQRLAADHGPLLARAARALDPDPLPLTAPKLPGDLDVGALAEAARLHHEAFEAVADALARRGEANASLEGTLLAEATAAVGDLVPAARSLPELAVAVTEALRTATAAAAGAERDVADLRARSHRKKELEGEVRTLEERSRRFKVLALELRQDRLVAFLQAEALHLLAVAGSERLQGLSQGRYRLSCRDEEFFVVDTWNGDEERSVRTLSGGETFLASLALALALAEQVRSLSVTDRARLDSLFLDEGFGTLDPETLRTVTDAIEQLGGDGRLVGVITHVPELADQFPRVEVTKSPRGSTLSMAS